MILQKTLSQAKLQQKEQENDSMDLDKLEKQKSVYDNDRNSSLSKNSDYERTTPKAEWKERKGALTSINSFLGTKKAKKQYVDEDEFSQSSAAHLSKLKTVNAHLEKDSSNEPQAKESQQVQQLEENPIKLAEMMCPPSIAAPQEVVENHIQELPVIQEQESQLNEQKSEGKKKKKRKSLDVEDSQTSEQPLEEDRSLSVRHDKIADEQLHTPVEVQLGDLMCPPSIMVPEVDQMPNAVQEKSPYIQQYNNVVQELNIQSEGKKKRKKRSLTDSMTDSVISEPDTLHGFQSLDTQQPTFNPSIDPPSIIEHEQIMQLADLNYPPSIAPDLNIDDQKQPVPGVEPETDELKSDQKKKRKRRLENVNESIDESEPEFRSELDKMLNIPANAYILVKPGGDLELPPPLSAQLQKEYKKNLQDQMIEQLLLEGQKDESAKKKKKKRRIQDSQDMSATEDTEQ
ncbi:Hypothetical_protein [Hexamita inflata]|uniref:Hypothetical_protein n=1 Tax=Hexamita inflata TaxID=28002 RepID=A0AA86Q524_9EUKA|nr:Hypothetical protein HINF_LOCUS38336 [Hexamita inflata]